MSDINLTAYNAFRRDLARILKTFNSYTQTDFTEETGTNTDFDCKDDLETNLSELYDLELK
ncbi:uncharacterized protein LOC116802096 [Drosophila sechellia]|uniref:Uncharacterized protein n=2 Tax=melanogaster subgroup TaxID=32351 RepID=A0A0J9R4N3_DROSI|nr:uncharacterized protein LOC27208094 [Drosophila simulans]XP_032581113.1 uncharacterized protein LOC116802096 [Drosophila sechellia]XP_033172941.1 uncharacterized protein LOC117150250 [Drosophila mauritiana]KMY90941.1 uncharacterized protein Dsimw501_GD28245 [Drosophila simulans]